MAEKITLEVLEERLHNWFAENKADHDEIIKQTTKTNGNVRDNRSEIDKIKVWQNRIIGGLIVLNVFIWPLVLYIIEKFF